MLLISIRYLVDDGATLPGSIQFTTAITYEFQISNANACAFDRV